MHGEEATDKKGLFGKGGALRRKKHQKEGKGERKKKLWGGGQGTIDLPAPSVVGGKVWLGTLGGT